MITIVRGAIVASVVIILIFVILLGADLGMIVTESSKRCSIQFPRWFGCVLANHEGLAGGLIGAAGALFAGWLAWTGALRQISAAELPSILSEYDRALRHVNALSYVHEYLSSLVLKCTASAVHGRPDVVGNVQALFAEGGLVQPTMPQASRENGLRVELAVRALREIASRLEHLSMSAASRAIGKCLDDLQFILRDIIKELDLAKLRADEAAAQALRRGRKI